MESLVTQLRNTNGVIFYNPDFKDFLEMNMADLRKASLENAPIFELSDTQRARATRNFNLLCNMANVPFHLHWVTLRVNNLYRYSDYRPSMMDIYKVDSEKLAELQLKFMDSQSIT